MSANLRRIIDSKRAFRRALAQRPIDQKLALLDELRDRALAIREAAIRQKARVVEERLPD